MSDTIFNQVKIRKQKFSTFDLSHQKKLTLKPGVIVPTLVMDCVPGDRIKLADIKNVRMQPMIAPVMHDVSVTTHYFFVPYRLLSENFENFIRGGESGTDKIPIPYLSVPPKVLGTIKEGDWIETSTLWDYLGLPTVTREVRKLFQDEPGTMGKNLPPINLWAFMAYHMIYNEYYRYQPLQPEFDMSFINEGENNEHDLTGPNRGKWSQLLSLRRRRWKHDYFTSALPTPQRGAPVAIPVYGNAPIKFKPESEAPFLQQYRDVHGAIIPFDSDVRAFGMDDQNNGSSFLHQDANGHLTFNMQANLDLNDTHYVDLTQAVATTVSDLRKAYVLQEWLEMTNNAGTRYFEYIKTMYNVDVKDDRLQRPEFIGGNNMPIMISEVVQTSESTTTSPLASMAGHGQGVGGSKQFGKFVEEFGIILGLTTIRPKPSYQNQLPKMFTKLDNFDYFLNFFEHIGEQPIDNMEVNYNWKDTEQNIKPFGYQSRYSEYKFIPDTVHGDIQDSLHYWAWNRKFEPSATVPLTAGFIECDPDYDIFALIDKNEDPFILQIINQISARRQMTYFSTPYMA